MFDWLFGKKPQPVVAVQQVPQVDSGPEMGFNELYKAVQDLQAGTPAVFRSANPLRQDQLERISYAVGGMRYYRYEQATRLLTVSKPLPEASL